MGSEVSGSPFFGGAGILGFGPINIISRTTGGSHSREAVGASDRACVCACVRVCALRECQCAFARAGGVAHHSKNTSIEQAPVTKHHVPKADRTKT